MMNERKHNKKIKVLIYLLIVILIFIVCSFISNIIRNNRINSQALKNINFNDKYTTIFCSGKNVSLSKKVLNEIMSDELDVVICNNKYIATIPNSNIKQKFSINIKTEKNKNYSEGYNIEINGSSLKQLKIKLNTNKEYLSEFVNDEFISNNVEIVDKFANIVLKDNSTIYTLAYIVPKDINLIDMVINKGATKEVDLGIDKKDYTVGSVQLESDTDTGIKIDGFNITGNVVGEYKLKAILNSQVKEAKIKVEPSVEKIEISSLSIEIVEGNNVTLDVKITPEDAVNKDLKWNTSNSEVATVDDNGKIIGISEGNCQIYCSTIEEPIVSATIQVEVKKKAAINLPFTSEEVPGITYVNGVMLVNKTHPIPKDYAPGLQSVAYNAFLKLSADAAKEGYDIQLLSGYRSYELQTQLYNNYCLTYGQAAADTFSAKPGTSEHQTGLAMDVGSIDDSYGDTPAGKWLAQNCNKYGFIIRYMKNKEAITGYKYEPWHIRYLGVDLATSVYNSGLCLEEYLGVTN